MSRQHTCQDTNKQFALVDPGLHVVGARTAAQELIRFGLRNRERGKHVHAAFFLGEILDHFANITWYVGSLNKHESRIRVTQCSLKQGNRDAESNNKELQHIPVSCGRWVVVCRARWLQCRHA
jgi:hypothetical protein